MDPVTWMYILTALTAYSGYQQNRGQAKIMEASAAAEAIRTKRAAQEAEAAGTAAANAERRKSQIAMSRAMAVAAASGSSGTGIETLIAGLAGEGEKQAGYRKYESIEQGKGLRDRAELTTWKGGIDAKQSRIAANNSVLQGVARGASIYSNYSGSDPAPGKYDNALDRIDDR